MDKTIELSRQEKQELMRQKLNAMWVKKKEDNKLKVVDEKKPIEMMVEDEPKVREIENLKIEVVASHVSEKKEQKQEARKGSQSNPLKTKKIKKNKNDNKQKEKKILRKAAGQVWQDKTLEDWNPNHFRIFCGNLGNEVHDQLLGNTFRNYNSFQKAKVIRDKRTGKSKGYGFVAFSNPKDFLKCLKQMNNKYIGSRPVKLVRSNWKDRNIDSSKNQQIPSDFKNYKKIEEPEKSEKK